MAIHVVKYGIIFSYLTLLVISCSKDINPAHIENLELMEIPKGFPEMIFPADNSYSYDRWTLGKKLFYDKRLSVDSTLNCASCHRIDLAFSDEVSFSIGVKDRIGTRNASTLTNVGFQPYYTREGGLPTLEMQALVPIQEHNEFDFNIVKIVERLREDSLYNAWSQLAYGRTLDPFVITRALATFQRSLISGNSPYDLYTEHNQFSALNSSAKRGQAIFNSQKTQCSQCHSGFNFTDYNFYNTGLYEVYQDEGRHRLTGLDQDIAVFKTPTLRNIELTSPYMHDGSLHTLEEVLNHYMSGGKSHPNKSALLKPFTLSNTEQRDLISFLKALTDTSFTNNPLFRE